MTRDSWAIALALAIGLWLLAAPFVLALHGTAVGADLVLGMLMVAASLGGILEPRKTIAATWIVAVLGVCVLLAPFVLGYEGVVRAMLNDTLAGVVTLVVALLELALEVQRGVGA